MNRLILFLGLTLIMVNVLTGRQGKALLAALGRQGVPVPQTPNQTASLPPNAQAGLPPLGSAPVQPGQIGGGGAFPTP